MNTKPRFRNIGIDALARRVDRSKEIYPVYKFSGGRQFMSRGAEYDIDVPANNPPLALRVRIIRAAP